MKHSRDIHSDEDMLEGSSFSVLEESSPQPDLSYIIAAAMQITPLGILYDRENKREHPEAMDVEEGETAKMPKKHKIEE